MWIMPRSGFLPKEFLSFGSVYKCVCACVRPGFGWQGDGAVWGSGTQERGRGSRGPAIHYSSWATTRYNSSHNSKNWHPHIDYYLGQIYTAWHGELKKESQWDRERGSEDDLQCLWKNDGMNRRTAVLRRRPNCIILLQSAAVMRGSKIRHVT